MAKSLALVATNMDVGKTQCTEGAPLVLMDLVEDQLNKAWGKPEKKRTT